MNNEILDPWNPTQNFNLISGINIILGPLKDKNINLREHIEFIFEDKGNNTYYLFTKNNDSTDFKHLYIKLYLTESIIENISKSKIYSGSEYLILGLQIIYRLYGDKHNTQCKLIDFSFFVCDRRINLFKDKKEEIQHKIISLLIFGSTFYMPFGFLPYNKNNMKNIQSDISSLVFRLWEISWKDIDKYMTKMIEIVNSNKYKSNIMIRNYNRWYNYWTNIYDIWIYFKNKYSILSPTPFRSFSFFTYEECNEFINWLELYSFKYINYNEFVFNNINKSNSEMAGIYLFKQLKNTINNVVWINYNVESQSMISRYKK
jgi:hypothetical protein